MMQALIIDDEIGSREYLFEALSQNCPEVTVVGTAKDAEQGYQLIKNTKPDLVFLDIEMPNGSGFDLLQRFDTIPFEVIFVTGFDRYALNAIKFNCLDFLLKPYAFEDVIKAVDKAKTIQREKNRTARMENLLNNLRQPRRTNQKIALPSLDGLEFVSVDSILHLEADGKYTNFHLSDKRTLLISRNIKEYEQMFEEYGFFRVHRKHMINLSKIQKYHKGEGGYVIMVDGTSIDVSRRKKEDFLNRLSTGIEDS